jgi:inhibitor of KinA
MKPDLHVSRYGNYIYVRVCDEIDISCNRIVHCIDRALRKRGPVWLIESVPAYGTLALVANLSMVTFSSIERELKELYSSLGSDPTVGVSGRTITFRVMYGGEFGPDLKDVATETGLTEEEVVRLHASRIYDCYMLGFSPGFVYLGEVDPKIRVSRLKTPRISVPEGSVGLAGSQTGFYGVSSPGGWRIIGRLVEKSFDVRRNPPSTVEPGDRVKFVPVAVGTVVNNL